MSQPEIDYPLVVLLGWGGSERRHLERYASWYQSQGCHTLIHITRLSGIADPEQANRVLEFFAQQVRFYGVGRRIVIHLFSNNGFFSYMTLLRDPLVGDFLRHRVVAQIFDSSPGVPDPLSPQYFASMFQRALEGIYQKSRWPIRKAIGLAGGALFGAVYHTKSAVRDEVMAARPTFRSHSPQAPIWAVYGPGDTIVPMDWIEAFLLECEERGLRVHREIFEGSRHVEHWVVYGDAYRMMLNRILQGTSHSLEHQEVVRAE